MNLNKNMKIYLIITLVVMFFCCPQIYAYYSKNDSKSVTIGTKDLIITGSTSATTYAADSNGVVSIPVTIKNDSGFAVNYNLTLSNTNLKFNDGSTVYSGTIAANTTSTVTLKIVEVNPLGTENTDIDMAVTGPYTKNIDIGSYVLTYDLTPPSCSMSISGPIKTGATSTLNVTCTDASGIKTTSLATSAISLSSSLGTLSNPTVTTVSNGYKYSFTYTAGNSAGTETFTLLAGKVSDNVNNTNTSKTATLTVQRDVKITFNLNGASSFTYEGTKYTSTTTLTVCTLSSETTCSVTMPTITAPSNTPTVIGWSTAAATHTATYTSGQTASVSSNLSLYAQTSKSSVTHIATFSCNGGTGSVSQKTCTIAATYNGTAQGTSCSVSLPTSGCSYDPWSFQGWNTSSSATSGATGSVSISSNKAYYAIWRKQVCLNIDANGCTTSASQTCTYVYNSNTTGSFPAPSPAATAKVGWTMMGYGSSSTSTSATSIESGTITITGIGLSTTTLTRYYVCQKPVTITFKQNGCTTADGSATTTLYNGATTASVKVPTKGLNNGWANLQASTSSSATSGTGLNETITVNVGATSTTANAYYVCRKSVTVTFKANGCTTADGSASTTLYNGNTSASVIVPEVGMNTGWQSLGASSSSSSTSQGTAMNSSMSLTVGTSVSEVTRYYNCSKAAITRKATFNCNTGTGSVSEKTCTIGAVYNGNSQSSSCSVSLPTSGCSMNNGFNFIGWNTNSNATTGVTGSVSISSNKTYYAIYEKAAITYSLIFDTNLINSAGTCNASATAPATQKCTIAAVYNGATQGTSCTVTIPTAFNYQTGEWDFNGWGTSSSSTSGLDGGSTVTLTGNTTRYATWAKPVTIYIRANGCTASDQTVTKTVYNYNMTSTFTVPTVTATTGWNIIGVSSSSSDTTGTAMGSSKSFSTQCWNSVEEYYYICSKPSKTYRVTYSSNATYGVVTASPTECTIPTAYNGATQATTCQITLPTSGYSYESTWDTGWQFNGWSTSNTGTSGTAPGTKINISSNSTRYGTWIKPARTLTATFASAASGATVTSASKTCTIPAVYNGSTQDYTCSVTAPNSGYSYSGWTFNGWGTNSSATSGTAAGGTLTMSSDQTYYATWKKNAKTYTATYNCNGGTGTVSSTTCTIPAVYNGASQSTSCSVTAPTSGCTYSGWEFQGWNANSGATTGFTGAVDITKDHVWYAIWKKEVSIAFKANSCGTTDGTTRTLTIYNGATSGTVTVPVVGMLSGWNSLGASASTTGTNGTGMGSSMTISGITSSTTSLTRYYNCYKDVTVTFSANGCTTASQEATMRLTNGATSGTVTVPVVGMLSGWNSLGASASTTGTNGTGMGSSMTISGITSSTTSLTRYYNCYKDVTVTFSANGCTTASQEATMRLTNGATSGTVTVPSATMNTNWTSLGASASSSSTSSGTSMGSSMTISGVASATTSVTRYYNCKKDVTVTFNANGCTTAAGSATMTLYNNATSGTVTVPSATMNTNWTTLGASASSSSTSSGTSMGSSMTISSISATQTSATRYYNCKKDVTVTFNANSCTSASGSVTKTLYNGATSTTVTVPTKDMINTTWNTLGASASASSTSQGTAMGSSMTISSIGSSTTSVNRYYNCYKEVGVNFYANYCTTDAGWVNSTIYNGATSVTVSMPTDYTAESGRTIKGVSTDASSHSASSTVTVPLGNLTNSIGYASFICTRNFDIIFKANGCATGDETVSRTLYSRDDSFTVDVPAPTMKTGWTNLGAASSSNATSGSTSTVSVSTSGYYTSKTFYYTCTKPAITRTAKFSCNVGSGTVANDTCQIAAVYNGTSQATSCTVTLPTTGCSLSGFDFIGWNISSSGKTGGTGDIPISEDKQYYAIYKKDVTVTFNANGCTTAAGSDTFTVYNGGTSGSVTVPTKTMNSGWTSLGASASASSTSQGTEMGSNMTISNVASSTTSVTRYYNCSKSSKTYTVSFNTNIQNDGLYNASATAPSSVSCTIGAVYNGATQDSTCNVTMPTFSYQVGDWDFYGWGTSSSSTSGADIGSTVTVSNSHTRYATWQKTMTVTFKANGCTTSDKSVSKTIYNFPASFSVTVPTASMNSGWTSLGVSSSSSSTSQGTAMGATISGISVPAGSGSSKTYYYNCSKASKTFTATYDCNGGSGSVADKSCTIPAVYNGASQATSCELELPSSGCSMSGFEFLGWNVSPNATTGGKGGTLPASSNKQYYAIYKKGVTVTFNANGCTTAAQTATMNLYNGATSGTVTVPSATMNTNWTTLGASASSSSTSSGTSMGSSMTISGISATQTSATRYYNCKKDVTVTFNANSCATAAQTATTTLYNGSTSATVTVPTATMNTSWSSLGASASSSAMTSGTSMGSTMSVTIATGSKTATRYYNCRKEVTITFNANGCTTGNATSTGYLYNGATTGAFTVPSATLKSGWSDLDASTSSGATTGTAPGGTLTGISVGSTSTTGTAYFVCNKTVTVTFNANGCTTGSKTATATLYNGGTSTSVTVPSATMNSGWTSLGASASSSSTSSGTSMGSSMSLTVASSVTSLTRYYNCSKASKTFTATYDCNGGSGSVANKSCTIPAAYNGASQATSCELELPSSGCSMSGFDFLGWNVNPNATTGGKGGTLPASSNKYYYAIYKKNAITYTVSFNGNGGSGSTGSVSCTIPAVYNGATQETSCSATLPSNGFTYSGWTFNGWGTGTSSTSGTSAGGSVTLTSNITRYATWKKTFTLTCSKGANVSSIGATSRSCSVYNGDSDGCTVYLPTITANTGYTSVGWGSSSGATSGTSAGSAYTLTASKTLYANATDQTAPTCGTVSNAGSSSSWAKSRTITVACSETSGSGCSQTSFPKTFSSGTSTSGTITISDNAGNTRNCTVATYIDNTAPTCYYSGTGATTWKNYDRTFTVHCSDNDSGCVQADYSKTFSTSTYITTGTITVYDNAGNSKTCTPFNVYIDKVKPTINCTVNSGGTSGVSVTVTASDSNSGLASNPSGTFTITSSKTYTATDNAGNSASCTVTVTSSTKYTRYRTPCTKGSYSLASGYPKYLTYCTAVSMSTANTNNYTYYRNCYSRDTTLCSATATSCYYVYYYTRSSCTTWGTESVYQQNLTSCSESTGTTYKYRCVGTTTYSGSA